MTELLNDSRNGQQTINKISKVNQHKVAAKNLSRAMVPREYFKHTKHLVKIDPGNYQTHLLRP